MAVVVVVGLEMRHVDHRAAPAVPSRWARLHSCATASCSASRLATWVSGSRRTCLQRRAVARQLLFGQLALGDVLHRAGHEQRFIFRGLTVFPQTFHPALLPDAVAQDAVLVPQSGVRSIVALAVDPQGLHARPGSMVIHWRKLMRPSSGWPKMAGHART